MNQLEYEPFTPLRDQKKCLSVRRNVPMLAVILLQLLTLGMFGYIAMQIAPLKTQVIPIIEKSAAVAAKINASTFADAIDRGSLIVNRLNVNQVSLGIDKASSVASRLDIEQTLAAMQKSSSVLNSLDIPALLAAIENMENNVLPSANRILPFVERNVTPMVNRLWPVLNRLPSFINETEVFIALIRTVLKQYGLIQ